MKTALLLPFILALVLFCGCSTTKEPAASVAEINIISAEFGMSTRVVDVTPRVTELIREHPEGFKVSAKLLGTDPAPGKRKFLTIRYNYQNKTYIYTTQGMRGLSFQTLIKHARKQRLE